MAVLEILKFPDPRLRKRSIEVKEITAELSGYCDDLLETMKAFSGIGLSAPQVNNLIRLIVADTQMNEDNDSLDEDNDSLDEDNDSLNEDNDSLDEDNDRYEKRRMTELESAVAQPLFMFNPVITKKTGKITYDEGCLSLPSYFETVERFEYIEVEGLDREGKKVCIKTDGLLSICIQHEIDHLDGKLFIDKLSHIKASMIKNKIKKFGYPKMKPKSGEEQRRGEDEGEAASQSKSSSEKRSL